MLEIFIDKQEKQEKVALVENGNLVEYYEEDENTDRKEGNIYVGTVKDIIPGMQSAFVDIGTEKNGFIHLKDILPKIDERKESLEPNIEIGKVIKPNQKLLVQIKKDSNDKKGARVSTHINLPGKYIVLMPNTSFITVSQKIEDKAEQERLINLVKKYIGKENGAIIRTSAVKKEKELIHDIEDLERKWKKIREKYEQVVKQNNKESLIYEAENILEKMIIDLSNEKIENIVTNDEKKYAQLLDEKSKSDELVNTKIILENKDVLDIYDIKKQLEKLPNRKIWLKCGGFITIDPAQSSVKNLNINLKDCVAKVVPSYTYYEKVRGDYKLTAENAQLMFTNPSVTSGHTAKVCLNKDSSDHEVVLLGDCYGAEYAPAGSSSLYVTAKVRPKDATSVNLDYFDQIEINGGELHLGDSANLVEGGFGSSSRAADVSLKNEGKLMLDYLSSTSTNRTINSLTTDDTGTEVSVTYCLIC